MWVNSRRATLDGVRAPTQGNLPPPLVGFVGREAELAELNELILNSRLVTLTGIGGIGKSTLSVWASLRGMVW
ncbi:ATP-binding protein [Mycobacterium marinum]|uniref:ATP-binding protein n=1 Tax=Mycobacterium marinum TaxID=1781 RepID=UPI00055CAC61|nr:ATP-binding protein [Mycobacterium marinum]AXN50164.1 hypothetical protein CCUG20998_02759 [Mycobacterium marinum]RFZ21961.1 hypothetical protein DSM43519_03163 [Mycobacterium marinum]RFZ29516.1 hypothetical protein NCTC2275_04178 [Mycobacterium marinum]RFZ30609.1 hypothetical protein KST_05108 [Mycobacterium marinum]WCS16145.1 ATP-binding protein [Mycobacterium marinum]